jgi:YARHG domain
MVGPDSSLVFGLMWYVYLPSYLKILLRSFMKKFYWFLIFGLFVVSCRKGEGSTPKEEKPDSIPPLITSNKNLPSKMGTVCPLCSTIKLTEESVANVHPLLLKYMRNEIAARRWHSFKDKALRSYFSQKSWYKLNAIAGLFSTIEHYNMALIAKYEAKWKKSGDEEQKYCKFGKKSALFDLNGDGKMERILYDRSNFKISINGITHKLDGENLAPCFTIVDLNMHDKQKEILVKDYGPSDDFSLTFLGYKEGEITKVGYMSGLTYTMDGLSHITVADSPGSLLCTWSHEEDYKLNSSSKLVKIPRSFYPMNKTGQIVTMKTNLTLIKSPTDPAVAFTVKKGDKVTIDGCDGKKHCKITNANGQSGWIELKNHITIKSLNKMSPEVFDGIILAG